MRRLKNVPWVILLLAGFAAGSTMESHARIQSTPTSTSELHRQLDLFDMKISPLFIASETIQPSSRLYR